MYNCEMLSVMSLLPSHGSSIHCQDHIRSSIGHENRFMLRVLVVDESPRLALRPTRGIPGLELIHPRPHRPSDHPIISPIPLAFGARESAVLPDVALLLEVRYCPEKWGPFHNVPRQLMGLMKVGWLTGSLQLSVSDAGAEARTIRPTQSEGQPRLHPLQFRPWLLDLGRTSHWSKYSRF